MDSYYQSPVDWTYSEAATNANMGWNIEWNFESSPNMTPSTYSFLPYQYSQLYQSNTNYMFYQVEPVKSLPDQYSLNNTSPNASDRRDSCHNLMDAWTPSNVTNAGYSPQPMATTTTMQGVYASTPSPTSQSFSSDQTFWSMQSPPSEQNLLSDDTPSPLSDDAGTPSKQACSASESSRTCYDHGCDGRVFSSRSNLLRHQRERAPHARLLACPMCGATFYRLWTRDYHVKSARCQKMWHRHQRYRAQADFVATSRQRLRHSYIPAV